ncbi:hypothetical protein ACLK19_25500 [Escherichia coli]
MDSTDDFFTETTPYAPSSPSSASKASSDHLVRACGGPTVCRRLLPTARRTTVLTTFRKN